VRAIRGKIGVVAALVLAVALALSALAGLGARPQGIPDEGPWAIALSHPEGDWSRCLDDPAMTDPLMTSDLPVSRVVAGSAAGATEADVRRVVDCLSATLTGGTIEVSQAGGADDEPVSG
jgi:hypothetical protein